MPTPTRIVEILNRLTEYLRQALRSGALTLDGSEQDGRLNSQKNEKQLSQALRLFTHSNEWFREQGLQLEVSAARAWYDFKVTGPNGLFIPVNVKVSSLTSADNLSSKEGLFYAVTGVLPETARIPDWESFCQKMGEHMGTDPEADYYFLVVNKANPGDAFWTSLKCLEDLRYNGSNPPYQCPWAKNRNRVERTHKEAVEFLLKVLKVTFQKRADPERHFAKYLERYIGG